MPGNIKQASRVFKAATSKIIQTSGKAFSLYKRQDSSSIIENSSFVFISKSTNFLNAIQIQTIDTKIPGFVSMAIDSQNDKSLLIKKSSTFKNDQDSSFVSTIQVMQETMSIHQNCLDQLKGNSVEQQPSIKLISFVDSLAIINDTFGR